MDATMKMSLLFFLMILWRRAECSHPHPLDPLTPSELKLVRTIVLKSYPNPGTTHRNLTFNYVGLDEPDKPAIRSWLSSNSNSNKASLPPRRAFVIARFRKQTLEIVLDLSTRSIVSTNVYHGHGYPMLTFGEQTIASELPFSYGPFKESIKKRGLNISDILCEAFTMGWFGEAISTRTIKVKCYYTKDTANFYTTPVDGVAMVVDLDDMKIVDFKDRYEIPVPKAEGTEYRVSKQKPPFGPKLKGIGVKQHDGPGFKIDGHSVRLVIIVG